MAGALGSGLERLRALAAAMAGEQGGTPAGDAAAAVVVRLDEPLRIAVTGLRGVGKSTLVDLLAGARVARDGTGGSLATVYRHGPAGSGPNAEVEGWAEVRAPVAGLASVTVVELHGAIPPPTGPGAVDAFVHVLAPEPVDEATLRPVVAMDGAGATAGSALAVVNCVDAAVAGSAPTPEAVEIGARVATNVAASLLGVLGAIGLDAADAATVAELAALPPAEGDALLSTTGTLVAADGPVDPTRRRRLAARLGIYSARIAVLAARAEPGAGEVELRSTVLSNAGGLLLGQAIERHLVGRQDALRTRTALRSLTAAAPDAAWRRRLVDAAAADDELVALGVHDLLRGDDFGLGRRDLLCALRLVGPGSPEERLGLDPASSPEATAAAADELAVRLRAAAHRPEVAEGPAGPVLAALARIAGALADGAVAPR